MTAACVTTAACSGSREPIGATPGRSNRPPGGPRVPANDPADAGPTHWERWSEVATFRLVVPRAPSQHLAGDHEGEILANVEAAAYPDLGPARSMPPGSVLVQRLYPSGAGAPDVIFAMVKRAANPSPSTSVAPVPPTAQTPELAGADDPVTAWEFLVLDADGRIESRGPLERCARCHAEAPHQGLFGRSR